MWGKLLALLLACYCFDRHRRDRDQQARHQQAPAYQVPPTQPYGAATSCLEVELPSNVNMPMHIQRPVLLVVDMQEFFRSFAKDVAPQVNDMIKWARDEHIPVIYTLHGHPDPEKDEERNVMVSYLGKDNVIKKDSHDYQLMPEVDLDTKQDLLIEKEVYSSFNGKPSLEKVVREEGYDGLIITGVCTNLCDETTSRDGVCRNIPIVLVKDAVATYTKEMHNASLLNIEFGFGPVLTHDEIQERWKDKKHFEVRQEKGVLPSKPSSGTKPGLWRWWPFGGKI